MYIYLYIYIHQWTEIACFCFSLSLYKYIYTYIYRYALASHTQQQIYIWTCVYIHKTTNISYMYIFILMYNIYIYIICMQIYIYIYIYLHTVGLPHGAKKVSGAKTWYHLCVGFDSSVSYDNSDAVDSEAATVFFVVAGCHIACKLKLTDKTIHNNDSQIGGSVCNNQCYKSSDNDGAF